VGVVTWRPKEKHFDNWAEYEEFSAKVKRFDTKGPYI
jgi:hypothetical protein